MKEIVNNRILNTSVIKLTARYGVTVIFRSFRRELSNMEKTGLRLGMFILKIGNPIAWNVNIIIIYESRNN